MNLLRKLWFRIIVSLVGGGATTEILHIFSDDPNLPLESNPTLIVAAILFVILTVGTFIYDYYKAKP